MYDRPELASTLNLLSVSLWALALIASKIRDSGLSSYASYLCPVCFAIAHLAVKRDPARGGPKSSAQERSGKKGTNAPSGATRK